MLRRLRVEEYALIDEVVVEFGRGLNVLTGETGAGKSILVDSLALLTGARAYTDDIREGADHATIEGLFEVDGVETVVRREIFRDRSNRCHLDGNLATARMLKERGEAWVEIHGQHDDHLLLKRAEQRGLLDAFAAAEPLVERVAVSADSVRALERERADLERAESERSARIEWLRSQVEEIEAAELDADEADRLEIEATRLRHAAERQRTAGGVWERLEGADEGAVVPALAALERRLEGLVELDPDLAPVLERVSSARYELQDIARELLGYADSVEHDPGRLAGLEERRDLLFRLERKHGGTVAEVVERGDAMRAELEALEASSERAASLDREIAARRERLEEAAAALADAREAHADRLEDAVRGRLAALGMGEGIFQVAISRQPLADGMALYAISVISRWLPRVLVDGSDLEAREQMMVGSLSAGISMKGGGAADHAFAHAVNALFHVHHGAAVARFLADAMELSLPHLAERFADIARALGIADPGDGALAFGRAGIDAVRDLVRRCGIPTLAQVGVRHTLGSAVNHLLRCVEPRQVGSPTCGRLQESPGATSDVEDPGPRVDLGSPQHEVIRRAAPTALAFPCLSPRLGPRSKQGSP
ncbi:MAG: iron-containing alcohol dehydrogenase [Gemmatimonadetes bacterium]|nr:iron-containing alcohol dehydrogenase [Gemmatimonadota bacterium]